MNKLKPVKKRDGVDVYNFIGGVAIVPGIRINKKPVKVTLKEFNHLRSV